MHTTGEVGSATAEKMAPKFHHGDINMRKLTLALATLVVIAGAGVARADSSGHMDINGLQQGMPRSYDALAPLDDGLSPLAALIGDRLTSLIQELTLHSLANAVHCSCRAVVRPALHD
jgi:hypothetical protein